MSNVKHMRGVRLLHPFVHDTAFGKFQRISADPAIL